MERSDVELYLFIAASLLLTCMPCLVISWIAWLILK